MHFEYYIVNPNQFIPKRNTTIYDLYLAVVSFVISDFIAYIIHYYFHKNRFLYRMIHSIHHENNHPTMISTIYMHPLEIISFHFVYRLPILIGIPFTWFTFFVYQTILISWTFLDHGFDVSIFSSHFKHHRLQHGNYTTCLNIWDILFNTNIR